MLSGLELASTSNLYEYFTYSISSLPLSVPLTVPPSVRAIPTSGQLQARKGGPITLECKGSGNPVPSIYWTKKVCLASLYLSLIGIQISPI